MHDEGVVKFRALHADARPPPMAVSAPLLAWRDILVSLGLVGQDPTRYGGAGFGNLSARRERGRFLITGTQTGALPTLAPEHLALVTAVDVDANEVRSLGRVAPSSEAMTHAAIYASDPATRAIVHAHSPEIWLAAKRLGLPATRSSVAYGTPAMAREVARTSPHWQKTGALSMRGHEDGVVTMGRTVDEAGARMVTLLARARALPARRLRAP